MTRVITIQTQKGGACKTTDTINFAIQLSKTKKVLVIDFDQQGNTTKSISTHDKTDEMFKKKNISKIFYEDEIGETINLKDLTIQFGDIYLIASSRKLIKANNDINNSEKNKWLYLYDKIQDLKKDNFFDFIFIDTNPAVDNLFMNAIYACDEIIIPCKPEQYDFDSACDTLDIIKNVNENCKNVGIPEKKINGVIYNCVSKSTKFHSDNMRDCTQFFESQNVYVYKNFIRRNIKIAESQSENLSVEEYAKNANGTKDFKAVINEFLEKESA